MGHWLGIIHDNKRQSFPGKLARPGMGRRQEPGMGCRRELGLCGELNSLEIFSI